MTVTPPQKDIRMTVCGIQSCGRTFQDGDKYLENGLWQTGYFKEGGWYCSLSHLKQADRLNNWLMFLMMICAMVGIFCAQFLIMPLFDRNYFELAHNTWAFFIALVISPLSFWVVHRLNKLG